MNKPSKSIKSHPILDVSGHKCPIPVLRLRRYMDQAAPLSHVIVQATDPMTELDIPYYCQQAGHELIGIEHKDTIILYHIRKCADD